MFLERREWGNFFGRLGQIKRGENIVAAGNAAATEALIPLVDRANLIHEQIKYLEQDVIGEINHEIEERRLRLRSFELADDTSSEDVSQLKQQMVVLQEEYEREAEKLRTLYEQLEEHEVVLSDANGEKKSLAVGQILRDSSSQ